MGPFLNGEDSFYSLKVSQSASSGSRIFDKAGIGTFWRVHIVELALGLAVLWCMQDSSLSCLYYFFSVSSHMVCSPLQYAVGTGADIPEATWYLVLHKPCSHQQRRFISSLLQQRLGEILS